MTLREFVNETRARIQHARGKKAIERFNAYVDVDMMLYTDPDRAEPRSAEELLARMRAQGMTDRHALRRIEQVWRDYKGIR